MQNLRFVERRNQELVFESESGVEFRFEVTDEFIDVVRATRRVHPSRASSKVSPRKIQALLRAGASRREIAEQLEIEEEDIQRYEGPILAEFNHMLTSARQVPVRTEPSSDDEPQTFGEVIEERLNHLAATDRSWSTWRDDEEGWMVQMEFDSHGSLHTAIWSFDHRKSLLSPITPDAVNLSKQGEVGDKLIPTLRVVDRVEEVQSFDAAFVAPLAEADDDSEATPSEEHPFVSTPLDDADYLRRQEIEQRAIAVEPSAPQDLGQTADLLDALRRRRSDRETPEHAESESEVPNLAPEASTTDEEVEQAPGSDTPEIDRRTRKGRASIPSWDDILFGTRSDDD